VQLKNLTARIKEAKIKTKREVVATKQNKKNVSTRHLYRFKLSPRKPILYFE